MPKNMKGSEMSDEKDALHIKRELPIPADQGTILSWQLIGLQHECIGSFGLPLLVCKGGRDLQLQTILFIGKKCVLWQPF